MFPASLKILKTASAVFMAVLVSYNASAKDFAAKRLLSSFEQPCLVVYFTLTGDTETIAKEIADQHKCTLKKIESRNRYSFDAQKLERQVKSEYAQIRNKLYPSIILDRINTQKFSYFFIGYPVWYDLPAPPVLSFMNEYKGELTDQTVAVFSTSESAQGERALETVRRSLPKTYIGGMLHFTQKNIANAGKRVRIWLTNLSKDSE